MRSAGKNALVAMTFISAVGFGMHVARGQSPPPMPTPTSEELMNAVTDAAPDEDGSEQLVPLDQPALSEPNSQPQVLFAPTPAPAPTPPLQAPANGAAAANPGAAGQADSNSRFGNSNNTNSNAGAASAPAGTPAAYVPSEVETILPLPMRLNEPRITIHTSMGIIRGKLYAARVPQAVNHFINLIRGEIEFVEVSTGKKVVRPFYENMVFHRVLSNYLIQTGCPFGNGRGGPGFAIKDELRSNLRFSKPGMIAMAPQRNGVNYVADSIGSQFFITAAAAPEFDDKATIIGEVTEGMDVVRKISKVPANPLEKPVLPVQLEKIEVVDEVPAKP